jgi:menaquinol-cytochrome c reductase iron-sulfur subunit
MASSGHFSRRDFIKLTTAAVGTFIGAAVGLPAIAYLIDPALKVVKSDAWIPLGKVETFEVGKPAPVSFTRSEVNGWEKTVTSYGVFVIKKSDNNFLVLSSKCTHLGCTINWVADRQEFVCPCHDAQFGIDGSVRGGPPPRPLDAYTGNRLKVQDGILLFHFLEG